MPFNVATDASTVKVNLALSKNWQVTLGGNRTLSVINANKGDELALVVVQDGTGGRTLSWPSTFSFTAGQAPALTTVAGGVDVFKFIYNGTTWRDVSGAPNKLPGRIAAVGLGTIMGVAITSVLTLVSSGGNNQRPGAANVPDIATYCTGSSCTVGVKVGKLTGSAALVLGQSGGLVIGSPTLDPRGGDATFSVNKKGFTTGSGYKITNAPAAQGIVCGQTGGVLRFCRSVATVVNGVLNCLCQ